jgi:hypothetical protein
MEFHGSHVLGSLVGSNRAKSGSHTERWHFTVVTIQAEVEQSYSSSMAKDVLPFEVKRLIYDYVDLKSFKSLRLVSTSWAAAGLEVLLLPTFFVRSSSIDVARLKAIGANPKISNQAAHIVKKLVFVCTLMSDKT